MKTILNINNHLLAYSDNVGNTDNPQQRNYDWHRKIPGVAAEKTASDTVAIQPGQSSIVLNSVVPTNLVAGDQLSLEFVGGSTYKLCIDAGTGQFNTARAVTGLSGTDVAITVNNNAVATFSFDPAVNLSSVQVGDLMRIPGLSTYDTPPFKFNDINSGLWRVLSVGANSVQVARQKVDCFDGVTETVINITDDDVKFYAQDGVVAGDNLLIDGSFSPVSHSSFKVVDATADCIYFTSTLPLPEETSVSYIDDTISIYKKAKFLVYLETDQKITLKINGDASNLLKIKPISAGNPDLVGFFQYTGLCYKLEVVNDSVNIATVRYFTAE